MAQSLADSGAITQAEIATSPFRHVLTSALATRGAFVKVELKRSHLDDGDQLLLCSDGLTDMVPDDVIARELAVPGPAAPVCRRLVDLALEAGEKTTSPSSSAGTAFRRPARRPDPDPEPCLKIRGGIRCRFAARCSPSCRAWLVASTLFAQEGFPSSRPTSRPRSSRRGARRSTRRSATTPSPSSRARRARRATRASASRTSSTTSAASRCRTRTCCSTARRRRRRCSSPTATRAARRARARSSRPRTPTRSRSSRASMPSSRRTCSPSRSRQVPRAGKRILFTPLAPAEGGSMSRDLALRYTADAATDPFDGRASREGPSSGSCASASRSSRSATSRRRSTPCA